MVEAVRYSSTVICTELDIEVAVSPLSNVLWIYSMHHMIVKQLPYNAHGPSPLSMTFKVLYVVSSMLELL